MQGKSSEEIVHIMDCANVFGMPKLMACCEYHIAADEEGSFKPVPTTLVPISCMLNVAEALHGTKRRQAYEDDDQICECCCCEVKREIGEDCRCHRPAFEDEAKYMPCPKELLNISKRRQVTIG